MLFSNKILIFFDFLDSRVEFYDFNKFHDSHMEFYDFHDFQNSFMEL